MDPRPESLLLVDDDEATRTYLADNLAADGFQVASGTAPDEAIRATEVPPSHLAVHLSAKQFALLSALAAEPARVFTKAELLRDVWGYASVGATRTIDAHACRLRRKLGGAGRPLVLNVRGVGYRLAEPA